MYKTKKKESLKIIIWTTLILLSLGVSNTYAGGASDNAIIFENEYYTSLNKLNKEVNKYYYAKFFNKSDEKELYSNIKSQLKKLNKNKENRKLKLEDF